MTDRIGYAPLPLTNVSEPAGNSFELEVVGDVPPIVIPLPECVSCQPVREIPRLVRTKP